MLLERALLEVAKFLTLREVLLQFQLTCTQWKEVGLKDEVLLHFLPDQDQSRETLSLYERVKAEFIPIRYLLNVANEQMSVWDLQNDSTRILASSLFLNSSRYVLSSMSTAIVTGGAGNYRSCVKVNLETGAIEHLPDLLHDRAWHGTTILYNEVYISGGDVKEVFTNTAEKYSQGRWVELPPMQEHRYNHTLSAYQSKVYAFGGSIIEKGDSIEAFDGTRWNLLEVRFPSYRCYLSIVTKGNALILIGGYDSESSARSVDYLNLKSNTWTELCSTNADYSLSNAAALRGEKIFIYNHSGERISMSLPKTQ